MNCLLTTRLDTWLSSNVPLDLYHARFSQDLRMSPGPQSAGLAAGNTTKTKIFVEKKNVTFWFIWMCLGVYVSSLMS